MNDVFLFAKGLSHPSQHSKLASVKFQFNRYLESEGTIFFCLFFICLATFHQNTESRSDDTSLATTPNPSSGIFLESAHRKRSLAIEIRNQQHLRYSGGSLPSSFQSAHLTLPLSGASPRYRRPRSSTPRFHSVHSSYRIGNNRVSEPESPLSPAKADDAVTASLPVSSEVTSASVNYQ